MKGGRMKIQVGDQLENIQLPSIDGSIFNTTSTKGKKVLLTFYRFASCPMCNLRINTLMNHYDELGDNFTMIAIFNSSIENLKRYTAKHQAPFPILADKTYQVFKKYGVKHSLLNFLISQITRGPLIWKAMFKGYIPWTIKGHLGILPVDVLIDEEGIVRNVNYGTDIGDHLPLKTIIDFSK